jgi:putative DNA primase/helicase
LTEPLALAPLFQLRLLSPPRLPRRLIDLKVNRKHGAFDDLKGMEAAALATKCKREATTNYGAAGPALVRALVENDITDPKIRARVSAFTDQVLSEARQAKTVLGQIERVAERLGVIAVAGELATEFGIVPWPTGEAEKAAKEALTLWIKARGGEKPLEEAQAITTVRKAIEAHGDSRFDDLDVPPGEDPFGKDEHWSRERHPSRDRLAKAERAAPDRRCRKCGYPSSLRT